MRVLGNLNFNFEAVGTEIGGIIKNGNYQVFVESADHHHSVSITLAKDGANVAVDIGTITNAKFIHVKAEFDDPTVPNATIEVIVDDGGGAKTITCTQIMLVNTDIQTILLTNNSDDSTGSAAKIFLDIAGD